MHHGYREYYETGKKSQQKNLSDIDLESVSNQKNEVMDNQESSFSFFG